MSAENAIKKAKLAVSKAQQAVGQVPPDLANRVTALESADQSFDSRLTPIEDLIASGYSGSISVVTSVNFTAQTTTIQTITIADGIITGVA